MISGMPPFKGQTTPEILANIKKGVVKINVPEFKDITPQCKDLLLKILQPEDKRISIE